jgi:hypothetical protein
LDQVKNVPHGRTTSSTTQETKWESGRRRGDDEEGIRLGDAYAGPPSPFPDSIRASRVVSSLAFWLGAVVSPFETAEILEVEVIRFSLLRQRTEATPKLQRNFVLQLRTDSGWFGAREKTEPSCRSLQLSADSTKTKSQGFLVRANADSYRNCSLLVSSSIVARLTNSAEKGKWDTAEFVFFFTDF